MLRIIAKSLKTGVTEGILGEGTYGGVDRVLPVDVYAPGCPLPPHAILNGLLVAMGVREARATL